MFEALIVQLGVFTTAQLAGLGWSKWQIEAAVQRGILARVRPGWFARNAAPRAVAAARAGGCIGCFDALRVHGVWVPATADSHVRYRRQARHRGCVPYGSNPPVRAILDDLEVAIRSAARCGTKEQLVIVLDSVLHKRLATREELRSWLAGAPARVRRLLDLADGRAESGTETMVRLRLASLRLALDLQVRVLRGIRVDLLIGDRLIIECDSREHHTSMSAYESDRERDRRLTSAGYIVIRLTYHQIHADWPAIEEHILTLVRRGDHRLARRKRR